MLQRGFPCLGPCWLARTTTGFNFGQAPPWGIAFNDLGTWTNGIEVLTITEIADVPEAATFRLLLLGAAAISLIAAMRRTKKSYQLNRTL